MTQVRIALVGIGGYGESYLSELLQSGIDPDVHLAAGIDPHPERCSRLNELGESGVPIYSGLEEFFQHDRADLVIISAPIHFHAPLTCLALENGANVLCEKPLAGSLADARQMQEAARTSGKFVAIGYQWSFSEAILECKRDILSGRLGRPLRLKTAVLWPRWRSYYQRNDWAGKIRAANGAWILDSPLNNATAHYLHNMLFLLGGSLESSAYPALVESELYRANPIENYDTAALRVTTESGVELIFLTSHAVGEERGPIIHYEFENGVVEYPNSERTFQARFHNGQVKSYGSPDITNGNKLWQSVDAVRTGQPVVCDLRAALPQLVCAAAAQQAPIHWFPKQLIQVQEENEERLTWVDGLFETLLECYTSARLPGESPAAAWAGQSTVIDLKRSEI